MTGPRWGTPNDDDDAGPLAPALTPQQAFDDPGRFYSERLEVAQARAALAARLRADLAGREAALAAGTPKVEDEGTALAARRQLAALAGAETELADARLAKEQWLVRRGGARGARLAAVADERAEAGAALAVVGVAQTAAATMLGHLEPAVLALRRTRRWDVAGGIAGGLAGSVWIGHLQAAVRGITRTNACVAGLVDAVVAAAPSVPGLEPAALPTELPIDPRATLDLPTGLAWWPVLRWGRATLRRAAEDLEGLRAVHATLTRRRSDLEAREQSLAAERIELLRF